MLQELWTTEGEYLKNNPEIQPWNVYPRPQMKRESFLNLNGQWDFTAAKADWLPAEYDLSIRVPFCPESPLSGVHGHFPEGSCLFYRRSLTLPEGFNRAGCCCTSVPPIRWRMCMSTGKRSATMRGATKAFPVTLPTR